MIFSSFLQLVNACVPISFNEANRISAIDNFGISLNAYAFNLDVEPAEIISMTRTAFAYANAYFPTVILPVPVVLNEQVPCDAVFSPL